MLFGRHINVKLSLAKNNQESPKEENDMNKLNNVKKHFKTNKNAYISGATALAVGVVGTKALSNPVAVQKAINQGMLIWKPVQNLEQTTVLVRRGHPGFIIKCVETGEVFASKARACEALNIARADLSKHLSGAQEAVKGLHFENLGEAI